MDESLSEAVDALERAAQQVSNRMLEHLSTEKCGLGVQFPFGVIRPLRDHYPRWPFLDKSRRKVVACAIQLCDVVRWHMNVWKLELTAGAMWQWHCTLPVVGVIETLLYEYGTQRGLLVPGTQFKKAIDTLQSRGVIGAKLRDTLHELREYRNEVHLYLKEEVALHDGKPSRYNQAVRALAQVENQLKDDWSRRRTAGNGC
jgi:hypothetical protein